PASGAGLRPSPTLRHSMVESNGGPLRRPRKTTSCPSVLSRREGASKGVLESPSKVEGDARDHGVRLEQEGAFNEERPVVVKQMMPPPRGNEFGQHDGDIVVGTFVARLLDVFEQRLHQRSKRRLQNDERHAIAPLLPVALQVLRGGWIDVDVDRTHIARQ